MTSRIYRTLLFHASRLVPRGVLARDDRRVSGHPRRGRQRPFPDNDALSAAAREEWFAVTPADWREAFAHHPEIGDCASLQARFPDTAHLSLREQTVCRTRQTISSTLLPTATAPTGGSLATSSSSAPQARRRARCSRCYRRGSTTIPTQRSVSQQKSRQRSPRCDLVANRQSGEDETR